MSKISVALWTMCNKKSSRHAPLHPMQVDAMDIMGPFPENEAGNSYMLVVGDLFYFVG